MQRGRGCTVRLRHYTVLYCNHSVAPLPTRLAHHQYSRVSCVDGIAVLPGSPPNRPCSQAEKEIAAKIRNLASDDHTTLATRTQWMKKASWGTLGLMAS